MSSSHDRNGGKSRPQAAFLAWGAVGGRSAEIAAELGGEACSFFAPGSERPRHVLVRYLLSSLGTLRYLAIRRPKAVIVTIPPIPAGLIVLGWSRLTGAPFVLDSHPGAFGAQGDGASARLVRVHRWLVRRGGLSLVAAPFWKEIVESWGGTALVLHEAPTPWSHETLPTRDPGAPFRVLYVGRFAGDEPFESVVEAARTVPECTLLVTGQEHRCPPALRAGAPANVEFVGFLDPESYAGAVRAAHAVLTLTTESNSVMRAGYEAVYALRPLICSDTATAREFFPYAVHVANDPAAIASGLRRTITEYDRLSAVAEEARSRQIDRFRSQLAALRTWLEARTRTDHEA